MRLLAILLVALALAGPAAAAARRIYSYDPADAATRKAAGALTFEFQPKMIGSRLISVRATEGQAGARVRPASEAVLGRGGLTRIIGAKATERDLYEILPVEEGPQMVAALCPGAARGFLAIGRLKANQPLTVWALGVPAEGPARLCGRLEYAFHGEWRLPTTRRMDPESLTDPHFPY